MSTDSVRYDDTIENRPSVLIEADKLINGPRQADYGPPHENFARVGRLWEEVLGMKVTAEQVALCLIQLKVARAMNGYQRDSLVDIAGYAGCIELIQQARVPKEPSW